MAGYTTIGLLTLQDQNFYLNHGFVPSIGFSSSHGKNYYAGGSHSRSHFFVPEQDGDFFCLSGTGRCDSRRSHIWFFLGYRVYVDFFEENVLLDIQCPFEKTDLCREDAIEMLVKRLSRDYLVKVVGENDIIDVRRKEPRA